MSQICDSFDMGIMSMLAVPLNFMWFTLWTAPCSIGKLKW